MKIEMSRLDFERIEQMLADAISKVEFDIELTKDAGLTVHPFEFEKLDMYRELAFRFNLEFELAKLWEE